MSLYEDAVRRFWPQVNKTETCWLWTGSVYGSNSYGQMWTGEKAIGAHRLSWEIHHGTIPAGQLVLHRCDTPTCVNPAHLVLGTHRDNMADMVRKGRACSGDAHWQRTHPEKRPIGTRNGTHTRPDRVARGNAIATAKLDDDKVRAIRELAEEGFTQSSIAARFGVQQSSVSAIVRGATWKHVQPALR